jgi:hypothetical protein
MISVNNQSLLVKSEGHVKYSEYILNSIAEEFSMQINTEKVNMVR